MLIEAEIVGCVSGKVVDRVVEVRSEQGALKQQQQHQQQQERQSQSERAHADADHGSPPWQEALLQAQQLLVEGRLAAEVVVRTFRSRHIAGKVAFAPAHPLQEVLDVDEQV